MGAGSYINRHLRTGKRKIGNAFKSQKGLDVLDVATFGLSSEGVKNKAGNLWNDATGVTAARDANKIQQRAADKALAQQKEMFETSRADLQPWREAGQKYLSQLANEMASGTYNQEPGTFTPQAFNYEEDEGYKFLRDQGEELVKRQAALGGTLYSGKTLKDLSRFGQGLASQEIDKAYNRYADERNFNYGNFADSFNRKRTTLNDRFARLSSLVTGGQNAAAGQASQAMQFGENAASSITNAGNAAAASRISQYNQQRGAVEGAINTGIDIASLFLKPTK